MNIHEYQAKELLRAEGVPIPPGEVATSPEQAEAIARKLGGAVVVKERMRRSATAVTSSTARLNASSLAFDGRLDPLSLRTNCSADARISSSVAGGSKLASVLMLRHMA